MTIDCNTHTHPHTHTQTHTTHTHTLIYLPWCRKLAPAAAVAGAGHRPHTPHGSHCVRGWKDKPATPAGTTEGSSWLSTVTQARGRGWGAKRGWAGEWRRVWNEGHQLDNRETEATGTRSSLQGESNQNDRNIASMPNSWGLLAGFGRSVKASVLRESSANTRRWRTCVGWREREHNLRQWTKKWVFSSAWSGNLQAGGGSN